VPAREGAAHVRAAAPKSPRPPGSRATRGLGTIRAAAAAVPRPSSKRRHAALRGSRCARLRTLDLRGSGVAFADARALREAEGRGVRVFLAGGASERARLVGAAPEPESPNDSVSELDARVARANRDLVASRRRRAKSRERSRERERDRSDARRRELARARSAEFDPFSPARLSALGGAA